MIIETQKLTYINSVLKGKTSKKARLSLMADAERTLEENRDIVRINRERNTRTKMKKSILDEIKEICTKYDIGSLVDYDIDNEDLRFFLKKHQKRRLWSETKCAKYNIKRESCYNGWKPYHRFIYQ